MLESEGHEAKALLLSAGGNDIVGDPLKNLLNPSDGSSDPAAHVNDANVAEAFAAIAAGYHGIIDRARARYPNMPILVHGYDYAVPLPDQGFSIPPLDGWLGEPMRQIGIHDPGLQAGIGQESVAGLVDVTGDSCVVQRDQFHRPVGQQLPVFSHLAGVSRSHQEDRSGHN